MGAALGGAPGHAASGRTGLHARDSIDTWRASIEARRPARSVKYAMSAADSACRLPAGRAHRPRPLESSKILGIRRFGTI